MKLLATPTLLAVFFALPWVSFGSSAVPPVMEMPRTGTALAPSSAKASTVVSPIEGIRVYPNPWRAEIHANSTINFDHLPFSSSVQIFTLSGHLVRTLSAASGAANWDRTNDSGDSVASGIYLYLVTDPQGGQSKGKLAILH